MVSQQHANFLINVSCATAADLEGLGEEVRQRVYNNSGVMLEWEIKRIGCALPGMERPSVFFPRSREAVGSGLSNELCTAAFAG